MYFTTYLIFTFFHIFTFSKFNVTFYHNSSDCDPSKAAISYYGFSIPSDFPKFRKCRYVDTYIPDSGKMLYHLAFFLNCLPDGRGVSLTDYHPKIGLEGCGLAPVAPVKDDPAFGFTLEFTQDVHCHKAASPDGDPRGESWSVFYDEQACQISSNGWRNDLGGWSGSTWLALSVISFLVCFCFAFRMLNDVPIREILRLNGKSTGNTYQDDLSRPLRMSSSCDSDESLDTVGSIYRR